MKPIEIRRPPTGNHRNVQSVKIEPATGKPNCWCPYCRRGFRGWVHTNRKSEYSDWLLEIGLRAKVAFGRGHKRVKVSFWILGGKADRSESSDLDNMVKSIGDALEEQGVIHGDKMTCVSWWDVRYLTRAEHMTLMGIKNVREDDLVATYLLRVEPIETVI